MAALSPRCCVGFTLVAGSGGRLFLAPGLLAAVASGAQQGSRAQGPRLLAAHGSVVVAPGSGHREHSFGAWA